jgi:hypothetical protein
MRCATMIAYTDRLEHPKTAAAGVQQVVPQTSNHTLDVTAEHTRNRVVGRATRVPATDGAPE